MQRINEAYTLEVSYLYSYASRIYGQDHTGYRAVLSGCQPSLVKAFKLELWKDVDQFVICTLCIYRVSQGFVHTPFSRTCLSDALHQLTSDSRLPLQIAVPFGP
jgi:hypothetical protein